MREALRDLLQSVRGGGTSIEEALRRLEHFPLLDLGHSRLDTQRELRCGFPEVVFGSGKTNEELIAIARELAARHGRLLITRVAPEAAAAVCAAVPELEFHPEARAITAGLPHDEDGEGLVVVITAGTADGPVGAEAALTARMLGARVELLRDVGVAGLHRVVASLELLKRARALVVAAGMEGALPSVVAGLIDRPVIAVPTSIGYGASLGGLAALLGMLNSCAAGVSVVNVDNGFGAGYAAALVNRAAAPSGIVEAP